MSREVTFFTLETRLFRDPVIYAARQNNGYRIF